MIKLTKDSSLKLQNDLRAAGIPGAYVTASDGLHADGTPWEAYGVKAVLKDVKTGNGVSRTFEFECDGKKEAEAMIKDLKMLARNTRAAIRRERTPS